MIQGMVPPEAVRLRVVRGTRIFSWGDTDKDHPFLLFEVAEFLLQDLVFALALLEAHQFQALLPNEQFNGVNESDGHFRGLLGGGKAVTEVISAKGGDTSLAGEFGDIGVQIHPVDAFQLQDHVIFLEFREAGR
jgi:hypothetical protein